jgi:hypothetical protein
MSLFWFLFLLLPPLVMAQQQLQPWAFDISLQPPVHTNEAMRPFLLTWFDDDSPSRRLLQFSSAASTLRHPGTSMRQADLKPPRRLGDTGAIRLSSVVSPTLRISPHALGSKAAAKPATNA